ncbi:hypothetical protein QVD17_09266 [Tagetes erecta]|uniref:Uncharacterized protein n=1 Tax=Tagetes erecta TaxID=13708 RepID=A0AAD8L703_TARER|nr:hypothetical protein QVD17_09266 [Tagetes erecta]
MSVFRNFTSPKDTKLVKSSASFIHEERKFCSAGPKTKIKSSTLRTPSPKIAFFDQELGSMRDRFGRRSNEKKLNKFPSSDLSPCVSTGNCLKNVTMSKLGSNCSKVPKMCLASKRQKDDRKAEKEKVVTDIKKDVIEVKGVKMDLGFEDNNLQLVDLYGEDDHLIPFPYREDLPLPLSEIFDNVNGYVNSKPRRLSFLRKSLPWDSAFMTSAGLLNSEELTLVNEGVKRNKKDGQRSKDASKICGSRSLAPSYKNRNICSQSKVKSVGSLTSPSPSPNLRGTIMYHQDKPSKLFSSNNNAAALERSENVKKVENKTTTAQDAKRSRPGYLPKSTSFTSPKTEKCHPKSKKLFNSPSSVLHFPLASSPSSSVDSYLSESFSPTTITHQHTIPVLDFPSPNSKERNCISRNVTNETIKSSRLRMPSPRIGFFDKEPGIMCFSASNNLSPCVSTWNCLKVGKHLSREHDERKVGSGCSKLKSCGKMPKQILKMDLSRKYDLDSFHAKVSLCSFEGLVNVLSRQLEVIDLERDMVQVRGQWIYEVSEPCKLFDLATSNKYSTVC